MKTLVIDLDNTLLKSEKEICNRCGRIKYKNAMPIKDEIDKLNDLFFTHNIKIIIWTGRNWDCYQQTIEQMYKYGIQYHELVMGKPQGVYVDRDAKTTLEDIENVINSDA